MPSPPSTVSEMSSISCVPAANAAMLFCAQLDKSSFWSSDFIHWSRRKWGIFSEGQTSRLNKFNIKNDKLINHHHFYLYSLKQQRSGIILLEIKQADFETKLGRCTHFVLSNSEIFFCPALHWNVKYLALKYEICSSQRFRCSNINSLPPAVFLNSLFTQIRKFMVKCLLCILSCSWLS